MEEDTHYTKKQMGDAGEMLVAAELTLAGVPALTVPSMWPDYDVIAQPRLPHGTAPQRVSVKTRTFAKSGNFVGYDEVAVFDWLAIVILPGPGCKRRRIFIVPRAEADKRSYLKKRTWRSDPERQAGHGFFVHKLVKWPDEEGEGLADYENNFCLDPTPRPKLGPSSA